LGLTAQKNIDQVFRKYKNDEGVMNMNFTGEILKMINSADKKLKSNVEIVDILVFEKDADISQNDKSNIEKVLTRDKFDLLIDVKNKEQKIRLYAVESGEYLNKVYAQVKTEDLSAYFILTGKIIFDELAKLGLDFQNGDALKILDKVKKK
jgi:Domain of unknown function (DUF4252)